MARYKFTATHGVHLSENGLHPWAWFRRAPNETLYAFETDDADIAERVRAVEGYGVTEVSEPVEAPKPAAKPTAPRRRR